MNKKWSFVSLNKHYDESEGHHVDTQHVIYIPEEIHWSIKHNLRHGKNMDKINYHAFLCLEIEELYKTSEIS